jgi:cytochrome c oxidase cbb3-type subunit 2
MLSARKLFSGWQGTVLVAVTYVYFLIFAQFAFLGRLASWQLHPLALKAVMASMVVGGILFSLVAPRLETLWPPRCLMRAGFCLSSVAAFLSMLHLKLAMAVLLGFLAGAGVALLTVTLATHVREWTDGNGSLVRIGFGTGLGYLISNYPPLFNASASVQALVSGLFCLLAMAVTLTRMDSDTLDAGKEQPALSPSRAVLFFGVLIWLDSAAFYIIQHTGAYKAATWQGGRHLYMIGLLHFLAAILAGMVLRRSNPLILFSAAFSCLAIACLFLQQDSLRATATIFYPVGVSLYSVALVAWPSLLSGAANGRERGRIAARLYAIGGWVGSALGIGMAEHLGQVPAVFLLLTGIVIFSPVILWIMRRRSRELIGVAGMLCVAAMLRHSMGSTRKKPDEDAAVRGRQVYISEGCIHCHSQYVRPGSQDVLLWGPEQSTAYVHRQHPPLIGNRRQGPDLSTVGARRSPLWLRMHFIDPPSVSNDSVMPSFAVLFHDQRGEDLIAYLSSLKASDERLSRERLTWKPAQDALAHADARNGQQLYYRFCATCHEADGRARMAWQNSFPHLPPNLLHGQLIHMKDAKSLLALQSQLAQIAKFGIPGTDMPGHETMSDCDIASIAKWIAQQRAQAFSQARGL